MFVCKKMLFLYGREWKKGEKEDPSEKKKLCFCHFSGKLCEEE